METKKFKKYIKEAVRDVIHEEMKSVVHEVLVEMRQSENMQFEQNNNIEENNVSDYARIVMGESSSTQKDLRKRKTYSKNDQLNSILQETADTMGMENGQEQYYDPQNYEEPRQVQNGQMMNNRRINIGNHNQKGRMMIPKTDPEGRPIDPNNVPDHIVQSFSKDYSKLLKKVEEKSKNMRGGN